MSVRPGQMAPDFKMQALVGSEFKDVGLSDYRGKWVVLFFYPLDFTFVCPTEVTEISRRTRIYLDECGCLGWKHRQRLLAQGLDEGDRDDQLPALCRPHPGYVPPLRCADRGEGDRAAWHLHHRPEGKVRWLCVHDTGIGRSVDEIIRALQALQTGELCPVNWKPGEKTLS